MAHNVIPSYASRGSRFLVTDKNDRKETMVLHRTRGKVIFLLPETTALPIRPNRRHKDEQGFNASTGKSVWSYSSRQISQCLDVPPEDMEDIEEYENSIKCFDLEQVCNKAWADCKERFLVQARILLQKDLIDSLDERVAELAKCKAEIYEALHLAWGDPMNVGRACLYSLHLHERLHNRLLRKDIRNVQDLLDYDYSLLTQDMTENEKKTIDNILYHLSPSRDRRCTA